MQSISLLLLEIRAAARRPLLLFVCLLGPFLLLGFLGYALSGFVEEDNANIVVSIVDHDQTFETKSLINQLQDDETLAQQLEFEGMKMPQAEQELQSGNGTGVVIIPEGFTADLRNGTNTPIEVWLDDQQPIESGVLRLLLDSAASYISAAQSGVNAVYDSVIEPMDHSSNRQQLLQQVIVTFTLEALDRNDLFDTNTVERGTKIGWERHGAMAVWMLGAWLALGLFITSRQSILHGGVSDRLRTMNLGRSHIHITQVVLYTFFLFIANETFFLAYGIYDQETLQGGDFHLLLLTHAFLQAALAAFLLALNSRKGQAGLWYVLLALPLLMASGILIPASYLPQWLSDITMFLPWPHIYQGLQQPSSGFLIVPAGFGLALFITGGLINQKVEKHYGYPA
ncbi:ABC-2 family transporter protein [Thalassobacillus cyri]|uniref:ABC-2 family transporter protein n=1 Tax=Thalassobacillus cyri TaxID=571932 RepID=A0A1H4HHC6_9BACI|nr:ABC transporter permease [Thalassobacillus cyri]SEB20472.1 ABC-2 family transporter protein [Thalassobacillus cyri]